MVGLAPGLGPVTGSPGPLCGSCVAVTHGGVSHGRCARVMTGGLEMLVLEGANARSDAGSECESFTGVRCTGFVDGDYSWDLSLGQHTGNEEI